MVHPSKAKGDQCERDALAYLVGFCANDPHLRENAMRMLGAGRKDDIGDLAAFDDVVVQVKACNSRTLVSMLRQAAAGAKSQQNNACVPFNLGLVKYPNARPPRVRWIAACLDWPVPVEGRHFGAQVSKAVEWIRDDSGPSREQRVAVVRKAPCPPMFLAPFEAWYAARLHALEARDDEKRSQKLTPMGLTRSVDR